MGSRIPESQFVRDSQRNHRDQLDSRVSIDLLRYILGDGQLVRLTIHFLVDCDWRTVMRSVSWSIRSRLVTATIILSRWRPIGSTVEITRTLTPIVYGHATTLCSSGTWPCGASAITTCRSFYLNFLLLYFLRESQRLTHGTRKSFVLAFSRHLGTVRLVNVEWQYDHDIDPLDPLKVCVLLLCTDSIHVQTLAVSSLISEPP